MLKINNFNDKQMILSDVTKKKERKDKREKPRKIYIHISHRRREKFDRVSKLHDDDSDAFQRGCEFRYGGENSADNGSEQRTGKSLISGAGEARPHRDWMRPHSGEAHRSSIRALLPGESPPPHRRRGKLPLFVYFV